MFDMITVKISETIEILKKLGYACEDVSPRDSFNQTLKGS